MYSLLKSLYVVLLCVGVDLVKQNSITQQILAQYLQKRLNRAGGSGQVGGGGGGGRQPSAQLISAPAGNDLSAGGVQRNDAAAADSVYAEEDDDIIGDARFYQGQKYKDTPHPCSRFKISK